MLVAVQALLDIMSLLYDDNMYFTRFKRNNVEDGDSYELEVLQWSGRRFPAALIFKLAVLSASIKGRAMTVVGPSLL